MSTRETAHGLASLGRHGDSVLVHMQPEEVSGLQALALANGTSLTINPHTGMPEAFNLGRALKSFAKVALPVAAGFALGPGGFGLFESALGAGLAVGAGAYALTGDPMYALSAGLGGAGGFGLGQNVGAYGNYIKEVPTIGAGKTLSAANATDIFKTPGLDDVLGAADDVAAASTTGVKSIGPGIDYSKLGGQTMRLPSNEIANLGSSATPSAGMFDNHMTGIKGIFGVRPEGKMNYADFLKQGYLDPDTGKLVQPSLWQDVATVGMPVLSAMQKQPAKPPTQETDWNYEGPYTMPPREARMPTAEETEQMRAAGSPEFLYFNPSNPVPGYQPYAQGGSIQSGGIRDLYGKQDDQANGAVLSRDGYGLGRLQQMYGGGSIPGYADGGQIPGIPSVAAPQQQIPIPPMAQPGQPQMQAPDTTGINTLLSQAVRDPLGRGMAKGGYLDGPGDGMSDSIPATIEGKQPARLADGEFVVPADVVSHLGNGSTKAGAKVLYKMMRNLRKARTGTTKQGKQINPAKFLPA